MTGCREANAEEKKPPWGPSQRSTQETKWVRAGGVKWRERVGLSEGSEEERAPWFPPGWLFPETETKRLEGRSQ